MTHRFVVMRCGRLETYTEFEDIQQHDEIDQWNDRLQQLMRIENARSS